VKTQELRTFNTSRVVGSSTFRATRIALRSAKESVLWLRACNETALGDGRLATLLLDEARQLARILAAIVLSTKGRG
jgi:hypothetical protein